MPICMTASFLIKAGSLDRVVAAVEEFVGEMRRSEPGTAVYLSLQDRVNPLRFMHLIVFEDERANDMHHDAPATRRFTERLTPELQGEVKFGDFVVVASK